MKSKLKCRLRLKIAVLTLIVFVCGFLLGLIAQRPKKDYTASAETTSITIQDLPYIADSFELTLGNPYQFYFDSSLYDESITVVFSNIPSNINLSVSRRTSAGASSSLSSGSSFTVSSGVYVRFANQSGTSVMVECEFRYTNPPSLSAPVLSLSGNTLSWNTVQAGIQYQIYLDGEELTITSSNSYTVSLDGIYTVRALGDGVYSADSPLSNEVTYTAPSPNQLATPVLSLDGSLMTWNIIPNAAGYYVYKNGEFLDSTTEPAINLRINAYWGNGTYQVQAIADPESTYTDSALSNSVTYTGGYNDVLGTPILSYNRYILSWNFIVYADTFYIYYSFNGQDYELQAVVNSLSYSPSINGYYYVVAHSFNGEYIDSPPSNIVNISNLTPTSSDNIIHGILSACNDFLNLRLFGDNSITIGFLFSLGVTGLMLGIIIRLFFHG